MTGEDIERIGRGLMAWTFPKAEQTHSAHFAVALTMRARPEGAALPDLRAAICVYGEAIGGENIDTAGYHETIPAAAPIGSCPTGPKRAYSRLRPGAARAAQTPSPCRNYRLARGKGWP